MRTETYEIVMPEKCRVMTEEEMEYEGGWLNFLVGAVATCVSIGATALGSAGLLDKKWANGISIACEAVSYVTMGVSLVTIGKTALAVSSKAATVDLITYSTKNGFKRTAVDTWDSIGSCLASACGDASLGSLGKAVSMASSSHSR